MTLLDQALDAVSRGFRVVPCWPRTKNPSVTPNGPKDATADEAQVRRWWAANPEYNIACNAGVIIDVDSGVSSAATAANIAKIWGLPPTLTVHTGGRDNYGVQFHFKGDAPLACGSYENINGCSGEVRLLSRNEIGIWAGSIHPDSGETYEIIIDLPLAEYPRDSTFENRTSGLETFEPMTVAEIRSKMSWFFRRAAGATPGCRNPRAHEATYFAARGFLSNVFDETETEIKMALFNAVSPLYHTRERNIRKMLGDSWNRGIRHGAFEVIPPYEDCTVDKDGYLRLPGESDDR